MSIEKDLNQWANSANDSGKQQVWFRLTQSMDTAKAPRSFLTHSFKPALVLACSLTFLWIYAGVIVPHQQQEKAALNAYAWELIEADLGDMTLEFEDSEDDLFYL